MNITNNDKQNNTINILSSDKSLYDLYETAPQLPQVVYYISARLVRHVVIQKKKYYLTGDLIINGSLSNLIDIPLVDAITIKIQFVL